MKILTPIFALTACILLAGCDDQEYNETGAVPPAETGEFATDTETDSGTDAILIIEDPESQSGMNNQNDYQSAKPPIGTPPADSQDAASQDGQSATEMIPSIEGSTPAELPDTASSNTGESNSSKSSSSQDKSNQEPGQPAASQSSDKPSSDQKSSGSDQGSKQPQSGSNDSPSAEQADAVKEVE